MPRLVIAMLAASIGISGFAAADIKYSVSKGSADDRLKIQIEFSASEGINALEIPNWAPGSYRYANSFQRVTLPTLTVAGSAPENFTTVKNRIQFKANLGSPVTMSYEVPGQFAAKIGHFSGPSTYYYVVGRKTERCVLKFNFGAPTPIAIGLDAIVENESYSADNFDVLADNPVTYGEFLADTYVQNGKVHTIAYRGAARNDVNRALVKKGCADITRMQGDFFGGLPYSKYVWHFAVNDSLDGAGGLEHLSSTQISLASGFGPRAYSVCSHEFFHLWNVKRIRSSALGPFDYNLLPQTGALWWLEGVTDYFAHTLLPRYGLWKKDALYSDLLSNVRSVRARPERLTISPYDASYRVREAAGGMGNSQGLGVSYYDTGWLAGFVLDIEILDKSNGKYSLDDVEKALWQLCKDDQPGFQEAQIAELCEKFGGKSIREFFDAVIMKPGEMPIEAQLAKLGLEIKTIDEPFPTLAVVARPNLDDKCVRVSSSTTPLIAAGQQIVAVNGRSVSGTTIRQIGSAYNTAIATIKSGEKYVLRIRATEGAEKDVTLIAGSTVRKVTRVEDMSKVSKAQLKLRKLFESKRRS